MRTAHRLVVLGIASSLVTGPTVMACLVEPQFKAPQIAFEPQSIVVSVPTPKLRTRAFLSPMAWSCGGALVLPRPPAVDGLIDLFGSVANLRAAMASERVSLAFDEPTVAPPCSLGRLADSEMSDPTRLRNLLLDDASYDWTSESLDCEEPRFAARLTFSSTAQSVMAEIAPQSGTVRIVVDHREVARAKLHLLPPEIETLLVDAGTGGFR